MSKQEPASDAGLFSEYLELAQLCAAMGVTPRYVRHLVSLGLLSPPRRGKDQAVYNRGHIAQIQTLERLKAKGWRLREQAELRNTRAYWSRSSIHAPTRASGRPSTVGHFNVGPTVEVVVSSSSELTPLMQRLIRAMRDAGRSELKNQKAAAALVPRRRPRPISRRPSVSR